MKVGQVHSIDCIPASRMHVYVHRISTLAICICGALSLASSTGLLSAWPNIISDLIHEILIMSVSDNTFVAIHENAQASPTWFCDAKCVTTRYAATWDDMDKRDRLLSIPVLLRRTCTSIPTTKRPLRLAYSVRRRKANCVQIHQEKISEVADASVKHSRHQAHKGVVTVSNYFKSIARRSFWFVLLA